MEDNLLKYIKDGSQFVLYDPRHDQWITVSDQVAVLFTVHDDFEDDFFIVLHKIGSPEDVQKHHKRYTEKAGRSFGRLVTLILPRDIPVEELNKIFHNTGYLQTFIIRNNINIDA